MRLRAQSRVAEAIGMFFGLICFFTLISIPVMILWAIIGNGQWYYPIIVFVVGGFCKAMCRKYKNKYESLFNESTEIDFAQQWMKLPDDSKKNVVIGELKKMAAKYNSKIDVELWVSDWDQRGHISDIVKEITEGYEETRLKKPYEVVCHNFIETFYLNLTPKAGLVVGHN